MNKSGQKFAVTSLSLSLAFNLVVAAGASRAESDSISNSSVPLETPSSTGLVKKIWGSLDVRKLKSSRQANKVATEPKTKSTKKEEETKALASTSTEPAEPKVVSAVETKPGPAETKAVETKSTESKVAETKAVETKASSQAETKSDLSWSEPEALSSESSKAETATTSGAKTEPASTSGAELTASAPSASSPEVSSASQAATAAETAVEKTKAAATEETSKSSNFTVGNSGRITVASQVLALPPGSVLSRTPQLSETQIVDSDEKEEVEETIKYEDLPTDEGKTKVKAGAKFPVVMSAQLTSKTAKKGDPFQARLKYELKIGDRHIANKGSVVNGHITYVLHARTILHTLVSKERWYRNSGTLGLAFDEIVNEKGEHLPLHAQPARASRIVKNKAEGRELGVNHLGQVTGPWGPQLRHKAVRIGLNFALAPAGVFSFGAMPVALGVIGAVNPNFAFAKPVGLNVRHRRLKGFAWGFLSGIPGSWLIEDTTVKGQECIIKPGDEFNVEFIDEFTGEQATDAQLMPGASTKLRGQVLTDPKKDKKKPAAPAKK
jgi:hypothetical protein